MEVRPVATIDSSVQPIPEGPLKEIIVLLFDYKNNIVNNDSLEGKNPSDINKIKMRLRNDCIIINHTISTGNLQDTNSPALKDLLTKILAITQNTSNSLDISIIARDWCNKVFIEYPLVLNEQHIQIRNMEASAFYKGT